MASKVKNYAPLKKIGDARLAEIGNMLTAGYSTNRVVKTIQEDWGVLTKTSSATLKRYVRAFRQELLNDSIQVMLVKTLPDKRKSSLNAMEELNAACLKQRRRVKKVMSREESSPLLLEQVSKELMNYFIMLEKLVKIKMDIGEIKRVPKEVGLTLSNGEDNVVGVHVTEEVTKAIEYFTDEESSK